MGELALPPLHHARTTLCRASSLALLLPRAALRQEVSFSLHELESTEQAPAGRTSLEKPYLRTKASLTVAHLKKWANPNPNPGG